MCAHKEFGYAGLQRQFGYFVPLLSNDSICLLDPNSIANPDLVGGWFVFNGESSAYAPMWASSFNVPPSPPLSSSRNKKVSNTEYQNFIDDFDRIEMSKCISLT